MKDMIIAVWFSCGAASAIAAKKTLEKYGEDNEIHIINNPIKEEHEDNRRFLKDVEKWLGVEIEIAENPKYPDHSCVTVWNDRKYMSGVAGAPCTVELKKMARRHYEDKHKIDFHVLGFTYEEKHRAERFIQGERENLIPILVDEKITKMQCYILLQEAGIRVPEIYRLGYPNANCIGCVKASSPTYWNHVRRVHPDVFEERAKQSREIGSKLVRYNGERIFLDVLPTDAEGAPMKDMDFECGLFCEEWQ